jgi:broad specificity phosphatase PhoE
MPASRQLILVRHAETQANVEGRWQGQLFEGSVTLRGQQQIRRLAERLRGEGKEIVALYSSPLGRAQQTAQGIGVALGLEVRVQDDLKEMDFGELDSLTMTEIAERHPEFFAAWRDFADAELAWPGGERRRDFAARVQAVLDGIVTRHTEGHVVVVGHGGSLRAGIGHLLEWPAAIYFSYNLYNCSLTRLVHEYGRWRLLTLNDICHLQGLSD